MKNPLRIYLVVVFALSFALEAVLIAKGSIGALGTLGVFTLMWIPGLVALFMRALRLPGDGLGWRPPRQLVFWLMPYALPALLALTAYGIAWLTGLATLDIPWKEIGEKLRPGPVGLVLTIVVNATVGVLIGAVFALGEEIGWRGYLVPLLVRAGVRYPIMLSGFIWGLWHLPLVVFGDYATSALPLVSAVFFMVMVTAASFLYAWTRLVTRSLWPAVILHASHNSFFQSIFDKLTAKTELSAFVVGESGVLPLALYVAVAVWLYRSGRLASATRDYLAEPAPADSSSSVNVVEPGRLSK